jgi:hypothetical protein
MGYGIVRCLKIGSVGALLGSDLVPGTNLETSLAENLQASASGVILWSSRTKDSEWCKRERQAMTTLKDSRRNSRRPFNYVFATLDAEPLPLFAQADLYIDFKESPEGPRGVNLLKLMWNEGRSFGPGSCRKWRRKLVKIHNGF